MQSFTDTTTIHGPLAPGVDGKYTTPINPTIQLP